MQNYFIEYDGDYISDDGKEYLPFSGTFEGEYSNFSVFIAEVNKSLRKSGYLKNDESLLDICFTEISIS